VRVTIAGIPVGVGFVPDLVARGIDAREHLLQTLMTSAEESSTIHARRAISRDRLAFPTNVASGSSVV